MKILYIAMNLVKRTIGTRKGFIFGILLPTAIISALVAIAGSSNASQVTVAYVDNDKSALSEHLISELAYRDSYKLSEVNTEQEARDMVLDEDASTALIIPKGYEQKLMNGETPVLTQVRLALSEATVTLEITMNGITQTIAQAVSVVEGVSGEKDIAKVEVLLRQLGQHQISGEKVEWHKSAGLYLSSVVGFMLMFLMIFINQSLTAIVEDRRNQTMTRIYAGPVYGYHIAVGNFLGSVMLGTIQLLFVMVFSRYVFQFDFGVSFLHQFVIMECFVLAALGIASAVGGFVKNSDQLGLVNNLIMTPTCMIGGCFWPVEFMPGFMQKMSNFVPQKWAIDAMSRLAQGDALSDVWLNIGILILFAAVLLGFGAVVLRPSEAK